MIAWLNPRLRVSKLWLILVAILTIALVAMVGFEIANQSLAEPSFLTIAKLAVFHVIKMTDIPLAEAALGSLSTWALCRFTGLRLMQDKTD
jgi:uncharacterized MnhB-related membrane protein